MDYEDVLRKLKEFSNPSVVLGMARFGINTANTFGVSVPHIRKIAKEVAGIMSLRLNCGCPMFMRRGFLQVWLIIQIM